jgi:hypothetical protein
MAINAAHFINKSKEAENKEQQVAALRPVLENVQQKTVTTVTEAPTTAVVVTPTPVSGDHHVLIVDGKTKKVGKRSQYLLDMMTIE